jgi:hypothetical protein
VGPNLVSTLAVGLPGIGSWVETAPRKEHIRFLRHTPGSLTKAPCSNKPVVGTKFGLYNGPWAPWPALLGNNLALEPPPISAPYARRRDQIRSLPWPLGFPIQVPGAQRPVVGTKFGLYVSC